MSMIVKRPLFLLLLALPLGGCISTVANVVTLPVRAVGQGVDWATTSQEESDRNYGRKMRKQEAREGREMKQQAKQRRKLDRERAERARDDRRHDRN